MSVFCTKCGTQNDDFAQHCSQCYATLHLIGTRGANQQTDYAPPYEPTYQPIQPPTPMYAPLAQDWQQAGADKKIIAGILGIVGGGLGIHKLILGRQEEGMFMVVVAAL